MLAFYKAKVFILLFVREVPPDDLVSSNSLKHGSLAGPLVLQKPTQELGRLYLFRERGDQGFTPRKW